MAVRSRMLDRNPRAVAAPMSEMNITPLIDVLLVLLVMIILAVPMALHRVDVDLPARTTIEVEESTKIGLTVQQNGAILWDGQPVSRTELKTRFERVAREMPAPVVRFEPEPLASYDASVRVINLANEAGVTKFAFAGNEKYRVFGKGD